MICAFGRRELTACGLLCNALPPRARSRGHGQMPHTRKNSVKTLVIRRTRPDDAQFLREMLFEAAYWRAGKPRPSLEEGLARPDLQKVLAGWGRPGDLGMIATDGQGGRIGAAWMRLWTNQDHAQGFVDEQTPEVGIGVRREFRRHGVGTALLLAVLGRAREDGVTRVSLSVEIENVARLLYERFGFKLHSVNQGVATLLVELEEQEPAPDTKRSPGNSSGSR
jgi:ribosomal protein S18 acetylase RimI-like enzyme